MGMKPEVSIPVALATAALTWGIYQAFLPRVADVRALGPDDPDVRGAERQALVLAVGVSAGVSLLAKDSVPFIVSGLFAVGLSWFHRHANNLDSETQTMFNRDQFTARRYTLQADS
jgi:hypothetical protein